MREFIFPFILLTVVIFSFPCKIAIAQDVLSITDRPKYPVRSFLQVYEAKSSEGIAEIFHKYETGQFRNLNTTRTFNIGATSSIWWFALPLKNLQETHNHVIFILATQNAYLITLYNEVEGNLSATDYTGYSIPLSEKKLNTRLFSFELLLEPKEEKVYFVSVDTKGGNLYLPFYMDAPHHYWAYETKRATHYGIFSGIFILALMISFVLWFKTREPIYGYYAAYIVLSFFLILEEDGYAFWWIYGDHVPLLSMILTTFSGTLGMVFMLQIMLAFHGFSRKNYIIYTFARVSQVILLILALANLLYLLVPYPNEMRSIVYNISFIGIIIGSFTALGGSIFKLLQGFKPAKLYLLAISVMIPGLLNYSLNTLGITNFNMLYPNGIVVGITLEIIILIFALAYRYQDIKKEKDTLLETLNQERKAAADQILQTLENERERLAKDLHDDLGGLLALIKMQLSHLTQISPPPPLLTDTLSLASKACNDLRAISHDLIVESQESRDLPAMINEIIRFYEDNHSLKFYTYYKDIPELELNVKITIFRMIKELMLNVIKHAEATVCNIQLIYDKNILRIMVEDNGVGFDKSQTAHPSNEGIGLSNIKSRVDFLQAAMHIESNFTGTTFIFEIPFSINVSPSVLK
ncbi:sensor histidine kinase [Anditalea andensis]|uniref:histidine kinase n=1 Tax=Anditalea andensis TaxID=1048983 RepID=A0A074KZW1_9BACT|nr:7TM diverse intracellular signaling domain-containing protein [Anditalea andensis]KEO73755.1 hypothetical protein EL17_09570 [Anditalea andensis]